MLFQEANSLLKGNKCLYIVELSELACFLWSLFEKFPQENAFQTQKGRENASARFSLLSSSHDETKTKKQPKHSSLIT